MSVIKKIAVANHTSDGCKTGRTLTTRAVRRANKKRARNLERRDAIRAI